jgi:hypothetical protein
MWRFTIKKPGERIPLLSLLNNRNAFGIGCVLIKIQDHLQFTPVYQNASVEIQWVTYCIKPALDVLFE